MQPDHHPPAVGYGVGQPPLIAVVHPAARFGRTTGRPWHRPAAQGLDAH